MGGSRGAAEDGDAGNWGAKEGADVGREFLEGSQNLTLRSTPDEVLHCLLGPIWSDPSVPTSGQNSRMQTGETAYTEKQFIYTIFPAVCLP